MDTPPTMDEMKGFFELVKGVGSVGWAVLVYIFFSLKKVVTAWLTNMLASSNRTNHLLSNLTMSIEHLANRLDEHERRYHGVHTGPRLVPRSSELRREPRPDISEPTGQAPEDI